MASIGYVLAIVVCSTCPSFDVGDWTPVSITFPTEDVCSEWQKFFTDVPYARVTKTCRVG